MNPNALNIAELHREAGRTKTAWSILTAAIHEGVQA